MKISKYEIIKNLDETHKKIQLLKEKNPKIGEIKGIKELEKILEDLPKLIADYEMLPKERDLLAGLEKLAPILECMRKIEELAKDSAWLKLDDE